MILLSILAEQIEKIDNKQKVINDLYFFMLLYVAHEKGLE